MEDQNLNKEVEQNETPQVDLNLQEEITELQEDSPVLQVEGNIEIKDTEMNKMNEAEYVYSLIESAIPGKDGFRKNIGKRDFALWVLPIVAINSIRRFTSKKTRDIVRPYKEIEKSDKYLIKGTETVYTSTKNVFDGKETMRFFGFRFMSIWVFPMAITGAFMEFLFVGPLNGTNPFG